MYESLERNDEIVLWCESNSHVQKCKKQEDAPAPKRQAKEDEIDSVYDSLKKKHGEKYEIPKLRLWAKMIKSGLHDSTDEPPDIPAFRSGELKKKNNS